MEGKAPDHKKVLLYGAMGKVGGLAAGAILVYPARRWCFLNLWTVFQVFVF